MLSDLQSILFKPNERDTEKPERIGLFFKII